MSIKIGIGRTQIFRGGGSAIDWSSYWATLISATVETAAPTDVVLTFPTAQTSLTDTDFTVTGFTVASGSWTGNVFTLVLSEDVLIFDGDLSIVFKSTNTGTVTNNVADDGNTVAWYDSSDLTTITKDANDFVSEWEDKLGSGNDLAQADANRQPKWYSDGRVVFDGIAGAGLGDALKSAAIAALDQPTSVYLVIKMKRWTDGNQIMDGIADNGGALYMYTSTPNLLAYSGAGGDTALLNDDLAIDVWGVVRILFKGATSEIQVDEGITVTGNMGSGSMGGITFGGGASISAASMANVEFKAAIFRDVEDANHGLAIMNSLKKKLNL